MVIDVAMEGHGHEQFKEMLPGSAQQARGTFFLSACHACLLRAPRVSAAHQCTWLWLLRAW